MFHRNKCSAAIPLAVPATASSARLSTSAWACHAFASFCIAPFTGDRNEIVQRPEQEPVDRRSRPFPSPTLFMPSFQSPPRISGKPEGSLRSRKVQGTMLVKGQFRRKAPEEEGIVPALPNRGP